MTAINLLKFYRHDKAKVKVIKNIFREFVKLMEQNFSYEDIFSNNSILTIFHLMHMFEEC